MSSNQNVSKNKIYLMLKLNIDQILSINGVECMKFTYMCLICSNKM